MAKERTDVAEHLKWRTEDIFASQADWDKTYAEVEAKLDFSAYEGKLGDAATLLACMKKSTRSLSTGAALPSTLI